MNLDFSLFSMSMMLGFALAMDAFSVSLTNGLNEPKMKWQKMCGIAGLFAAFQFLMPLIGWVCVATVAQIFSEFEKLVPLIALVLLCFIGGKMLVEGIENKDSEDEKPAVGIGALLLQGLATSIDALSAGTASSEYNFFEAVLSCLLIGVVTFVICLGGIVIGKKAGTKLANKAGILGGVILILIGLKIFITSIRVVSIVLIATKIFVAFVRLWQ